MGGHVVTISDLNMLNFINKNDKFVARSDMINDGLKKVGMFESGVIANNNLHKWKQSRGIALGAANDKNLADYSSQAILELLDKESNTTLEAAVSSKITMKPVLMRVMIELLGKTIFNLNPEFDHEISRTLAGWIDGFLGAWAFFTFLPPWLWYFFPQEKRRHEKCVEDFFKFENNFVDKKKVEYSNLEASYLNKKDLMFAMFDMEKDEMKDEEKRPALTRNDIRAIMNDIILGGTDTTANTTSMAIYHLSRNLGIQDRLHDEIADNLAKKNGVFDPQAISKLPFLDAVVQEVFRFLPPTTLIVRQAIEDVELEGYNIRKGTVVIMNLYAAYRDEKFCKNPDAFNPDRFMEGDLPRIYAFGLGKRSCPGQNLGLMNTKLILAKLFLRFRMKAVRSEDKLEGKYQLVYSVNPKCTDVFIERR
jgi:cytochrome P450